MESSPQNNQGLHRQVEGGLGQDSEPKYGYPVPLNTPLKHPAADGELQIDGIHALNFQVGRAKSILYLTTTHNINWQVVCGVHSICPNAAI